MREGKANSDLRSRCIECDSTARDNRVLAHRAISQDSDLPAIQMRKSGPGGFWRDGSTGQPGILH